MAQDARKRIGIIFNYDRGWLGGVYYLLNIIKALGYLQEEEKPTLVVLYNENNEDFIEQINYPYLEKKKIAPPRNPFKNYLQSWLSRKNKFVTSHVEDYQLDGLFPLHDFPLAQNGSAKKLIAWYPDLQHKFYPEYFGKLRVLLRDMRLQLMVKNAEKLVLSSEDVRSHFEKFYTMGSALKVYLLPFVSILDEFKTVDAQDLRKKYDLPQPYFIVSNQLYPHKNHTIVLKALKVLQEKGLHPTVVFTGKFDAAHYEDLFQELTRFMEENNLQNQVKILGLVSRNDQLNLIKNAEALIQPSKFEGWSTVIEDGKSLQVQMIVSNINIHREQLQEQAFFFDPNKAEQLAEHLENFMTSTFTGKEIFDNYQERIQLFARRFVQIYAD